MERRFSPLDSRAANQSGTRILRGYAAVFDVLSGEIYGFRERIQREAFADSLADDVRALWNHNAGMVLGRTKAGTLKLWEDSHGLGFQLAPPDTKLGRGALASIGRGDVTQMSFGFAAVEDGWEIDGAGAIIRTLRKVKLFEVSPVAFPAYEATSVSVATGGNRMLGDVPKIPDDVVLASRRRMRLLQLAAL